MKNLTINQNQISISPQRHMGDQVLHKFSLTLKLAVNVSIYNNSSVESTQRKSSKRSFLSPLQNNSSCLIWLKWVQLVSTKTCKKYYCICRVKTMFQFLIIVRDKLHKVSNVPCGPNLLHFIHDVHQLLRVPTKTTLVFCWFCDLDYMRLQESFSKLV